MKSEQQLQIPFFRTEFNYDRDAASKSTALICEGKSLTLQSQAADADINVIVKRCLENNAPLPEVPMPPRFGDFDAGELDYGEALRLVRSADQSFMRLPAEFRAKLDNDPARFVAYCEDPANLEELRGLGLAVPKEPENPAGPTPAAVAPSTTVPASAAAPSAPVKPAGTTG